MATSVGKALIGAVGFSVLHYLCDRALNRWSTSSADAGSFAKKSRSQQAATAQSAVSVIAAPLQGGLYFLAALSGGGSMTARLVSSSAMHKLGLEVNLAVTLYETGLYIVYGKGAEFWAHHVLGLWVLGFALASGQLHQIVAWAGTAEVTGLPLALLDLFKTFGVNGGPAFVANGALLWLGFLTTRVVSLPICATFLARDLLDARASGLWASLSAELRYIMVPAVLFIWGLSSFWFSKITKGLVKAVRGSGGGGDEKRK